MQTRGTLCVLLRIQVTAIILAACSGSADLGSKKPPKPAQSAAPTDPASNGSSSGAGSSDDATPALDSKQNASKEADSTVDSEEDLRIVPPEVVSGAYLACSEDETSKSAQGETAIYGCAINDANDEKADIEGLDVQWNLTLKSGEELDARPLEIVADSPWHVLWEVNRADLELLAPSAVISGSNEQDIVVKKRGVVTITGGVP